MKIVEALVSKIGILLFFILISCSSDDEPIIPITPNKPDNPNVETPKENQICLITSVDGPTLSYILSRNELELPLKLTFTKYRGNAINYTCTFEYDDSKRLIKLENETIFFTYKYDDHNRVISEKVESRPKPGVPPIKPMERIFTYNNKGYLDSAYFSSKDYQRYEYDDNGNVVRRFVKYPSQSEFLIQEYLEFDVKKNPYYEFSFYHTVELDRTGVIGTFTSFNPVRHKNNLLQTKVYESDGTFTVISVTYNYNDSGYPISSSSPTTFGYQCR